MSNIKKRKEQPCVVSVNISKKKGTVKNPVSKIIIDEKGILGDAHAGAWHRQISLLSIESIQKFADKSGQIFNHGDFAENITTQGIDLLLLKPSDQILVGKVKLEVTQIGKTCHGSGCAIYNKIGKCIMPKEGIFCKVIKGGEILKNDNILFVK